MTVTVIGEVTLGNAVPGVAAALATAQADIQAKVAAFAAFQVTPPSITTALEITADMNANLQLAADIGITPPSVDAQAAFMLEAAALARAQLDIILELYQTMLASVHLYRYDGPTGNFGTEMQAELSSGLPGGTGSDIAFALTFIATAGSSIAAMQDLFRSA